MSEITPEVVRGLSRRPVLCWAWFDDAGDFHTGRPTRLDSGRDADLLFWSAVVGSVVFEDSETWAVKFNDDTDNYATAPLAYDALERAAVALGFTIEGHADDRPDLAAAYLEAVAARDAALADAERWRAVVAGLTPSHYYEANSLKTYEECAVCRQRLTGWMDRHAPDCAYVAARGGAS